MASKSDACSLLLSLTQFQHASDALVRLFKGFGKPETVSAHCLVLLQLFNWQNTSASRSLENVLNEYEEDEHRTLEIRRDMELTVMGKPALLFATALYDEDMALLIWSGFVHFHARYPTFDLTRQVLNNAADPRGYSALHYAIEAQMMTFLWTVCNDLNEENTRSVISRIVTQDVTVPVNFARGMGKHIASGGCSVLHLAAKRGELELVKLLIAPPICMDPTTLRDWDGNSPAQVSAIYGHEHVAAFLQSITGEAPLNSFEVDALRLKREEMAEERYMRHLKPQEFMLEPSVFTKIWSIDETELVRREVNRVAAEQGWCKDRHASYQTTDIPCHHVAKLNAWVRSTLKARLFPLITTCYNVPETQSLLFRDLFFVKYEAREGERSDLALHRDGSVLSFNVLLNSPNDFTGGGTYFDATKRTIHITQGDVVVHSGKVLHAGAPVLSGIRQLLVGFLDVAECAF